MRLKDVKDMLRLFCELIIFDAVAARALVGDNITSGLKKDAANQQAISRRDACQLPRLEIS